MKKHIIKIIIVLTLLFIGFLLGDWYAHEEYYKEPTYFECLSLGSDWARKECIDKYGLKTKLPTHKEKINFQEEKGSSTYDRLTR